MGVVDCNPTKYPLPHPPMWWLLKMQKVIVMFVYLVAVFTTLSRYKRLIRGNNNAMICGFR